MKFYTPVLRGLFSLILLGMIACAPTVSDVLPTPDLNEDVVGYPADELLNGGDEESPAGSSSAVEAVPNVRDNDRSAQLVYLDSVEVMILESFPVQVHVALAGSLADGCVSVDKVTPHFDGEMYVLEIEASRPSDMMCTAVLAPYEAVVALDVVGLPAGSYIVQVQEHTTSFTLDMDNDPLTESGG